MPPLKKTFLVALAGLMGCLAVAAVAHSAGKKPPAMVTVRVVGPDGNMTGPVKMPKVVLSEAEWQTKLTPEQYRITRGKDTERAFCGGLLKNKEAGLYVCVCCNLPLFESTAKFESGTGWPSFFQPVAAENIRQVTDRSHGMVRVEILCPRCDAHLGHVFDDGPPPTGRRYCLNSEALRFVAQDKLKTLGEKVPGAKPGEAKKGSEGKPGEAKPGEAKASAGSGRREEIVLAGGCFWCVEAVFEQLDGVLDVVSGYAGGSAKTANYEAVCTGKTGHAESVKIVFDPDRISLEKLLKVHFATHDPTTLNRQGADVGTQYRSVIFYANAEQKEIAQAFLEDIKSAKVFRRPVVTTLEPLKGFYPAEPKHQDFVACHPQQGYVQSVALPKVEKVRAKFRDLLKPEAGKAEGKKP